jgi:hypothetical protein
LKTRWVVSAERPSGPASEQSENAESGGTTRPLSPGKTEVVRVRGSKRVKVRYPGKKSRIPVKLEERARKAQKPRKANASALA